MKEEWITILMKLGAPVSTFWLLSMELGFIIYINKVIGIDF